MRIDDVNRSAQTPATEKANVESTSRGERDKTGLSGDDSATLSPLAQALQPTNPKRLEQLRADVQSGQYKISSAKVAHGLIDDTLRK